MRAVDHTQSGQEIAFIDLKAGEHFGELSALDGGPRSATVYAVEDTVVAEVPGDVFVAFLREHADVALRMMTGFARSIRFLNGRVVGLSSMSGAQRVYGELLQIAEPDPTASGRWVISSMPRHSDIAIWAGTTSETVARALGRLLGAKVAMRRQKSLYILDRSRLQELATAE